MFHLLRIHFVDFSFSFCFCVSWLLPEGMLPSVSPESAGLLCALWSAWRQKDLSYDPAILFFLCLVQQFSPKAWKPCFIPLQHGSVADDSDADPISCSVLSLITFCCKTLFDTRFFQRWWNDLTAFRQSYFKKLSSALFPTSVWLLVDVSCGGLQTLKWHRFSVHCKASASLLKSSVVIPAWWKC